jgi:hypothetical protein
MERLEGWTNTDVLSLWPLIVTWVEVKWHIDLVVCDKRRVGSEGIVFQMSIG